MMLNFGPIKLDTKGMPAVADIHVNRPVSDDRPALVYLRLAGGRRADVEKWAKRLGTEVTEQINRLYEHDATPLEFCATVEADGFRVEVYTRAAAEPAPPAAPVLHWPAPGLVVTTWCGGEPLNADAFAPSEAAVTCPQCAVLVVGDAAVNGGAW
ncbi:MAG: hypothetical protein ACRDVE_02955 [Actinocrinis sp.]